MPQLVPFYFFNEIIFTYIVLSVIIYISSKYVLPRITNLFLSRLFILELFNIIP